MGETVVGGCVIWESSLCAGSVIFSPDRDTSADDTVERDLILGVEVEIGSVSTGLGSPSAGEVVLCCGMTPNGCALELDDGTGTDVEWVRTEGGSNKSMA